MRFPRYPLRKFPEWNLSTPSSKWHLTRNSTTVRAVNVSRFLWRLLTERRNHNRFRRGKIIQRERPWIFLSGSKPIRARRQLCMLRVCWTNLSTPLKTTELGSEPCHKTSLVTDEGHQTVASYGTSPGYPPSTNISDRCKLCRYRSWPPLRNG